jgi:hypothetical protein
MKFALFYEIPVRQPWKPDSEHLAYKNTLDAGIAGEAAGFSRSGRSSTTSRGVLALLESRSAVRRDRVAHVEDADRLRRAAHSQAVQPPGAHGGVGGGARPALRRRVDFGTGRSATRLELEGFGVDPADTPRDVARGIEHVVDCWTNERTSFQGKHWSLPVERRVQPKPLQQPHPPIWGATTSDDGHQQVGELGLGCARSRLACHPKT